MSDPIVDDIAAELRRLQDAQLRARPLPALTPRPGGAQGTFAYAAVGLFAAAAVAAVIVVVTPRSAELTVDMSARGFVFSDGSHVAIDDGSLAKLRFLDDHGATVDLVHGGVAASFLPRADGAWAIEAGAYALRADGARLDASFDDGRLVVHVLSGAAVLSGPDGAHALGAGATFVSPEPHVDATPAPAPAAPRSSATVPLLSARGAAVASPAPLVTGDSDAADASPPGVDADPDVNADATVLTWQQLARADRHAEAVTVARGLGIDDILAHADAADCLLLGASARLAVDVDVAERAYAAARARFGKTPEAARAAFFLARLAADVRHDDDGAMSLLRLYVAEAPDDAFAQEARGRIVEILARTGRHDEAAAEARLYLKDFPRGPSAALAHSLTR